MAAEDIADTARQHSPWTLPPQPPRFISIGPGAQRFNAFQINHYKRQWASALNADALYEENVAPWDIGESQDAIRQLAALGAVEGNVLDPGCGTGWHSIEYARLGCNVMGIDASRVAIDRARNHAEKAGVSVIFNVGDVVKGRWQEEYEGHFDTVVDSKCFDNLKNVEARRVYAAALHRVTKPGARLFMFGFGPGQVNGIHNHNHVDFASDYERILPAAGFEITYVGMSTYQLLNLGWAPGCPLCPSVVPPGRLHIPGSLKCMPRAAPMRFIRTRIDDMGWSQTG